MEYSSVQPWGYLPQEMGNLLVFGINDNRYQLLKKSIAETLNLMSNTKTIMFDMDHITNNVEYKNIGGIFREKEEVIKAKDNLAKLYSQRKNQNANEWIYVYISNGKKFKELTEMDDGSFEGLISNSIDRKIAIIIADEEKDLSRVYSRQIRTAIFSVKKSDQSFYDDLFTRNEVDLQKGQAYFRSEGSPVKIKLVD